MRKKELSLNLFAIGSVLFCALLAELYRFHGYLLLDFMAPLLVGLWFLKTILKKERVIWPSTVYPAVLFVLLGASSLLIHSENLSFSEYLGAAFYSIRWTSLFLLSVLVFNQSAQEKAQTGKLLLGFLVLLATAGFVQWIFVPDFTAYEDLGWDPHQGRLLSTWFDPNFVGGCLAFFTPILLGFIWDHKKSRLWILPLLAGLVIALTLTLSRSSYVALAAGLLLFGFSRSLKLLGVGALVLLALGLTVTPVQDRFLSLVENLKSVSTETYTLPDASARLRYDSWRNGWLLFIDSPLLGQGYNRYKYAALENGLLKDTEIHAASGSDSSLLTLLATTGILGALPFLSLYALLFINAWRARKSSAHWGAFCGLSGLFLHSIFVNSLFFPLFLAPFWISMGLLQKERGVSEWPNVDQ